MGMGPLMPTVNPTAAGLVNQSMNGGLPSMASPAQNGNQMQQLWQMLMANSAASGKPMFSMDIGTGKGRGGIQVGGGVAGGNMDLMKLLAMIQMMQGPQGTRPGPARGGQQAGPPQ